MHARRCAAGVVAVLHLRLAVSSRSRKRPPPASSRRCSSPRCRLFFSARSVGVRRWLATAVGLIGVLIILRPGSGAFHPAAFFPIVSALAWACTLIMTRMMSGTRARHHHHDLFVDRGRLHPVRAGAVRLGRRRAGTIFCSASSSASPRPRGNGSWCWRSATRDASVLAPFSYTQLLWVSILGFLMFGEVPDIWTVTGAAFIVASGLYTAHRERVRRSQLLRSRPSRLPTPDSRERVLETANSCVGKAFAPGVELCARARFLICFKNRALVFCFDAFSRREPVSTSLENAIRQRNNPRGSDARSDFLGMARSSSIRCPSPRRAQAWCW